MAGRSDSLRGGVVDWRGEKPPSSEDLRGRRVLAQGLMSVEVFTKGDARVLGSQPDVAPVEGLSSAFRDFAVGTKNQTWG
jgi:hypothetical protein